MSKKFQKLALIMKAKGRANAFVICRKINEKKIKKTLDISPKSDILVHIER